MHRMSFVNFYFLKRHPVTTLTGETSSSNLFYPYPGDHSLKNRRLHLQLSVQTAVMRAGSGITIPSSASSSESDLMMIVLRSKLGTIIGNSFLTTKNFELTIG